MLVIFFKIKFYKKAVAFERKRMYFNKLIKMKHTYSRVKIHHRIFKVPSFILKYSFPSSNCFFFFFKKKRGGPLERTRLLITMYF